MEGEPSPSGPNRYVAPDDTKLQALQTVLNERLEEGFLCSLENGDRHRGLYGYKIDFEQLEDGGYEDEFLRGEDAYIEQQSVGEGSSSFTVYTFITSRVHNSGEFGIFDLYHTIKDDMSGKVLVVCKTQHEMEDTTLKRPRADQALIRTASDLLAGRSLEPEVEELIDLLCASSAVT